MATYIPGAETLGYGFNVFGTYSANSKISPLFEMSYDDTTWKDYLVPENTGLDTSSKHYGELTVHDSRKKVEEHFAAKLSIKGSYGFFSAQFDSSFSMSNKSDVSYSYALSESYSKMYGLSLKNKTESALAEWVLNDPDYLAIPDNFSSANRDKFFRFFDKFGIAFISEVILGARLYYSTSILKEYNYSSKDIKVKAQAEYNAIFSVKASASAEWSKAGESWASQREVKVSADGGDNSILNILSPGYGANHEDAYKSWLQSAENSPAVIDFKIESIDKIFSGAKAIAVKQAIDQFLKHKIYVESKTGSCLINFDGSPVLPPAGSAINNYGWQLVAIDRSTLKVAFQKSYTTYDYWRGYDQKYNEMLTDITPFNKSDYIIAFSTFTNFALTAPNSAFVKFLENCGADVGLRTWLDTKSSNGGISSCCQLAHTNYCMVGIPGFSKGQAHESFKRAGSCDTGDNKWSPGYGWLAMPAEMAAVMVDVYELEDVAAYPSLSSPSSNGNLVANIGTRELLKV